MSTEETNTPQVHAPKPTRQRSGLSLLLEADKSSSASSVCSDDTPLPTNRWYTQREEREFDADISRRSDSVSSMSTTSTGSIGEEQIELRNCRHCRSLYPCIVSGDSVREFCSGECNLTFVSLTRQYRRRQAVANKSRVELC